jgi:hypothetical protein
MSEDRLFMSLNVVEVSQQYEEAARRMATAFTEGQLLANDLDHLVDAVVADKVPRPLVLDMEHHTRTSEIVTNPASKGLHFEGVYMPSATRPASEAIKVSLFIPYTGTRQALTFRPSRAPQSNPPTARVDDREVVISVTASPDLDGEAVEKQLLDLERNFDQWVREVNADIAMVERQTRALVSGLLASRTQVLRQRDEMVRGFTIPIREIEPQRGLEIPVKPTTVILEATSAPSPDGSRHWRLADPVYERMIKTITKFGHALERCPASARLLLPDEETLRDWLMFQLSLNYETPDGGELFIGGEIENGKGKTDILVRYQNRNAFIGECKFWHGPKKFREAIEQLLGYTVWRDTKAAIILFITNQDATAVIDKAGDCLTTHPACRQALVSADPYQRRDYRFASPEDDQRMISLALLPVIISKS